MISSLSSNLSRKTQFRIIILLVGINIAAFLLKGLPGYIANRSQNQTIDEEISLYHRRYSVPLKVQNIHESNHHEMAISKKFGIIQRIKQMPSPVVSQQKIRIFMIKKMQYQGQRNQSCAFVNSLNALTQVSKSTITNLLQSSTIGQVIVIARQKNQISELLNAYSYDQKFTAVNKVKKLDSDYKFVNQCLEDCQKIVYLFGNHELNIKNVELQMRNLGSYWASFSSEIQNKETPLKLKNLVNFDLEKISALQLCSYVFILKANLLKLVSPLNFAYYTKYLLQEALLLPVLAIAQQSKSIKPMTSSVHKVTTKYTPNYYFPIFAPAKEKNSICFISYPTQPAQISEEQVNQYIQSLLNLQHQKFNISVVIYLPFQNQERSSVNLFDITNKMLLLIQNKNFTRLRLRLTGFEPVSTLAAYESVYHYCPNQSLIVTSRHNVRFQKQFGKQIAKKISQKYDYIHTKFTVDSKVQIGFEKKPEFDKSQAALKSDLFEAHFRYFQIFKSDFLKKNVFWALKSDQINFYQTQLPLVLQILQGVFPRFQYINKTLVNVMKRELSQREKEQISNIGGYTDYSDQIITNNKILPIGISCLLNKALMRFAPDVIDRNIHQIWVSNSSFPQNLKIVQNSLKSANPSFNMKLWSKSDITPENLPKTYSLIQRLFEYHKNNKYSLHALVIDLMRYEIIQKYGGLHIDLIVQGKKPLDKFLKYEAIFTNANVFSMKFRAPMISGNPVMGASQNDFHLKRLLHEIIFQQVITFGEGIQHQQSIYRIDQAYTYKQIFSSICFGSHLFLPFPYRNTVSNCSKQLEKFENEEPALTFTDLQTGKVYGVHTPCKDYPQSFIIDYAMLRRTQMIAQNAQYKKEKL